MPRKAADKENKNELTDYQIGQLFDAMQELKRKVDDGFSSVRDEIAEVKEDIAMMKGQYMTRQEAFKILGWAIGTLMTAIGIVATFLTIKP